MFAVLTCMIAGAVGLVLPFAPTTPAHPAKIKFIPRSAAPTSHAAPSRTLAFLLVEKADISESPSDFCGRRPPLRPAVLQCGSQTVPLTMTV